MEGLSQNERTIWNFWESKTPREVVREAAAKGSLIKLAHKYLMHKNSWDEETAVDWFRSEVFMWVDQLLQNKQIFKARHILDKSQIKPEQHILNVARNSTDIKYRDYLVEQLMKNESHFKETNLDEWNSFIKHWNLLRFLEKSFESEGLFKQNKVFGSGKDITVVTESEIKSLTIDKIEGYPEEWKMKIAAYLFFSSFEFTLLEYITPITMWNHLIDQNKAMILIRWINMNMSELVRDKNARYNFFTNENFVQRLLNIDTSALTQDILEKLDEYFREWSITDEMIKSVVDKKCFFYTKLCIYDTLASYGIIVDSERNNLQMIVSRLARTQNLRIIDVVFNETCATMSRQEFYTELAKYCVKNSLYGAFTSCIDHTVFSDGIPHVDEKVYGCIELWLQFKSIEQTSDKQSHVLPIFKTCEQIARNNIDSYICNNPHIVLGMILLDERKSLFDIFTKDNELNFKEFDLPLQCSFEDRLPHLKNVATRFKDGTISVENDVTIYQLLSGYRGLDITKIFEFQLVHHKTSLTYNRDKSDRRSLGSLVMSELNIAGDEVIPNRPSELPHFTNQNLMKKYGHVAKLNYLYYLKQCRPCMASQAFVTYQYQHFNRLHDKAIKSCCSEAHALALQNWNETTATASGISFIAMIGCNNSRCRTHISAATMIRDYMIKVEEKSKDSTVNTINCLLQRLSQNDIQVSREILQYLEKVTMHNIYSNNDEPKMPTILYEWQTAVKFAILQNVPLPELQLKEFVKYNLWFPFLIFGDVFRYPQQQMLSLSQDFRSKPLREHLKHIIMHRTIEDVTVCEKDSISKGQGKEGQKRVSRLNSAETSPTHNMSFEYPELLSSCDDFWEVLSMCHTQEDPPGSLIQAAATLNAPILALVATCYGPDSLGICWANWILSILCDIVPENIRNKLHWDISDRTPTDDDVQYICTLCLENGYVRTLHESMIVFFPESPLAVFTAFLCNTIWQLSFDNDTLKLLTSFTQYCQRRYSSPSVEDHTMNLLTRRYCLQMISVSLVKIAIVKCFDSAHHQKEFLRCLYETNFGKDFTVPTPDFSMLYMLIQIAMETSIVLDFKKIFKDETKNNYLMSCIQIFLNDNKFQTALSFASAAGLHVDDILIAECLFQYNEINECFDDIIDDKERLQFIAKCSEAFNKANVSFEAASTFLLKYIDDITEHLQKFYAYRIIMSWYNFKRKFGTERENIEHAMWNCYLMIDSSNEIMIGDYQSTINFIFNDQKLVIDEKSALINFDSLLEEIDIESDVYNITTIEDLTSIPMIEKWRELLFRLLDRGLIEEAFRLCGLYSVSKELTVKVYCPCLLVRTALKLAEGRMTAYELPVELRLLIAPPTSRSRLSGSETSDFGFEELVVINEKSEETFEVSTQLAGREDADRLNTLDSLASRSGVAIAKQVASYYRISLQIGWSYEQLLKYKGNPIDFISYVSGRARMTLANLVFRTYNIPSKEVADYLSLEMVSAIISPHLLKTSSFRQKEHFLYTLWGCPLNSDVEMFLNMRPDACSLIGRSILDHLLAFGRIYRSNVEAKIDIDDCSIDVETLIDEEYQTVETSDLDTLTQTSGSKGTANSMDSETLSDALTVYSCSTKMTRESRRNLFDVISKCNVHIPNDVKANIKKITKGAKLTTKQVNIISLELLVLAHDSFSSACDTEGIAVVLKSAQALVSRLLAAKSWRLMVRLLTGLGRYTEMAYVFQMLRENSQFEFLLGQFDYMIGQQQEKISEFKQGLLDYLKNHCPGDTDTYCMVAHHFNMYPEAADVKRRQANDLIESLRKMCIDNTKGNRKSSTNDWMILHDNSSTRLLLETALNHCTDGAEWYLHGGCIEAAREMAGLGQQIALQMSLLSSNNPMFILNIGADRINTLVIQHLGMLEGLILCQAVDGNTRRWRDCAYARLHRGDVSYAKSMANFRPDLAYSMLNRYHTEYKQVNPTRPAFAELKNLV